MKAVALLAIPQGAFCRIADCETHQRLRGVFFFFFLLFFFLSSIVLKIAFDHRRKRVKRIREKKVEKFPEVLKRRCFPMLPLVPLPVRWLPL